VERSFSTARQNRLLEHAKKAVYRAANALQ